MTTPAAPSRLDQAPTECVTTPSRVGAGRRPLNFYGLHTVSIQAALSTSTRARGLLTTRPRVAILSLGSPRRFGLRPRGGGAARWFTLEGGDLLVMGGRCQHEWEHTVPKAARGGPRISVTYRHAEPGPGD